VHDDPDGAEIFVGVEPIDLRWGFDRLSGIVTERMARPPRSGALFVFFGKRRDALRILFADASGLCLFSKAARSRHISPSPGPRGGCHERRDRRASPG
jgi:transposase